MVVGQQMRIESTQYASISSAYDLVVVKPGLRQVFFRDWNHVSDFATKSSILREYFGYIPARRAQLLLLLRPEQPTKLDAPAGPALTSARKQSSISKL